MEAFKSHFELVSAGCSVVGVMISGIGSGDDWECYRPGFESH